jgi:myo-inositol-1(or 4)-monophosphatase
VRDWNVEKIAALLCAAGRTALRHYESPEASFKADRSIVTAADKEIEALLAVEFDRPEEGAYLIGEETCATRDEKYIARALTDVAWIVDPIDGTAPYAAHVPTWGISIGYAEGGVVTEGAIFLPVTGEIFVTDGARVLYACDPRRQTAFDRASLGDLPVRRRPLDDAGLVAITQAIAKRGKFDARNSVHALSCAVMPMPYLCLGRYLAYIGTLCLWDFAGGLAIVKKCGFTTRFLGGGAVTGKIADDCRLEAGGLARWAARDHIIFAPSEEVADFVAARATDR